MRSESGPSVKPGGTEMPDIGVTLELASHIRCILGSVDMDGRPGAVSDRFDIEGTGCMWSCGRSLLDTLT